MQFTVDGVIELGIEGFIRLRSDGTWRELDPKSLMPLTSDFVTDNERIAATKFQRDGSLVFEGTRYKVNPSIRGFGSGEVVDVHVQVHRKTAPHRFTLEELQRVIAGGVDDRHRSLVVNVAGRLELRDSQDARDASVAVRFETFDRGNGYVGAKAAADEKFLKDTLRALMRGWASHLETGKQQYTDITPVESVEDLEQELDKLYSRWAT